MPFLTAPPLRTDRAQAITLLAARLLTAPLFLVSGSGKVMHFAETAARMAGGSPMLGTLLTVAAICAELGGGVFLVLGVWDRLTALGLIVFTIIATLMFHQFWAADAAHVVMQTTNFLKNLSIVGCLSLIGAFGAGPYALRLPQASRPAFGA